MVIFLLAGAALLGAAAGGAIGAAAAGTATATWVGVGVGALAGVGIAGAAYALSRPPVYYYPAPYYPVPYPFQYWQASPPPYPGPVYYGPRQEVQFTTIPHTKQDSLRASFLSVRST